MGLCKTWGEMTLALAMRREVPMAARTAVIRYNVSLRGGVVITSGLLVEWQDSRTLYLGFGALRISGRAARVRSAEGLFFFSFLRSKESFVCALMTAE